MRRKDREVTDPIRIRQIIESCDTCRLGLWDGERVYVVPLSFGYVCGETGYSFYFHCAREGRKLELLRKGAQIAFQMDSGHRAEILRDGYTMRYRSACGYGNVFFLEDLQEKKEALRILTLRYMPEENPHFTDREAEQLCVFRLDVTELSCKENMQKMRKWGSPLKYFNN